MSEAFLRLIRGQTRGPLAGLARAGLRVASWGFGAAARVRGRLYDGGWLRSEHPGVPVISVGNVSSGGTGKTPTVAWVAARLAERGRRVGVLSRGYGALAGESSDESRMLRQLLPELITVEDPDRRAGARRAIEAGADVLVLDDGLQHRRIARDLELVLVSALDPDGAGALLPRGLLREPLSALRRADVILLTHADQVDAPTREQATTRIRSHARERPVLHASHRPIGLSVGEERHPPDWLDGRAVLGFCGLGSPESLRRTLEQLGAELRDWRAFADHHPFSEAELAGLAEQARAADAELAVTSRKDAVRIATWPGPPPLAVIDVGLAVEDPDGVLEAALDRLLAAPGKSVENRISGATG